MCNKPIQTFMPEQGEIGVMMIWWATKSRPKWVEVRGKNVRDYDENCPFHKLHDCARINKSAWHAEEVVTILYGHPDWKKFAKHLKEFE